MFLRFTALITSIIFVWNTIAFGQISTPEPRPFQPLQIIHIQDAHANYTAQKNICELIERFQKEQGIDLVFVEGAVGSMDGKNLRFSPDPSINKKVTDKLARMGELSGADLYLLKEHVAPVQFVGLEDPKLYAKNLESFRAVFAREKETTAKLRAERAQLDLEASRLNNKNLLALLRHYLNFELEKNQIQKTVLFLDQLSRKNLNRNFRDAKEQKDFPNLVRLLRLMEDESKINLEAAKKEAKQIGAEKLLEPSTKNPRFLLEEFYAAQPKGFDFKKYPNFSTLAKNRVYQYELKSQGLFDELLKLMALLFDSISAAESEKDLIRRVKEYVAKSRLVSLELTREEWDGLKTNSGDAVSFYQAALNREKHFMSVIHEIMRKKKKQRAIVIAGGFHTNGLKSEFARRGIDCQVITPEVKESSREIYVNSILGNYRANLDRSQFPAADWGNGWNTQSEMKVPVTARQTLVNGLIAQVSGASLGAKKEESETEKKDRRERVVVKMSELLQVSSDKIREMLDSNETEKPHLKSEGMQGGWKDLLGWAKGILEDLDIADAKFIDNWQKYNVRMNRLDKRIKLRKERDAKYWEIDKKKKTAKAKNKKLHAVADRLIVNLRNFIDDEIDQAWEQKGLLRRMQIAPFQKVRRSVSKLIRDLSGDEAVRLRRQSAFGVAPLTLKQSQAFVEEQKDLFQQFQQMHSPKPSYSRRHEKIATSTVSGLDIVSEGEIKPQKSGRQKKGSDGSKSKGHSLGIAINRLSQISGVPEAVIYKVAKEGPGIRYAGLNALLEWAAKIQEKLDEVEALAAKIPEKEKKPGFVFRARTQGFAFRSIASPEEIHRKKERLRADGQGLLSRLRHTLGTNNTFSGAWEILSLSSVSTISSVWISLTRIYQHAVYSDAREALRDTLYEEGFPSVEYAQQFIKDREKEVENFNFLAEEFLKNASLLREALQGKSLGAANWRKVAALGKYADHYPVERAIFNSTGTRAVEIYYVNHSPLIRLLDVQTGLPVGELGQYRGGEFAGFSPDGTLAAVNYRRITPKPSSPGIDLGFDTYETVNLYDSNNGNLISGHFGKKETWEKVRGRVVAFMPDSARVIIQGSGYIEEEREIEISRLTYSQRKNADPDNPPTEWVETNDRWFGIQMRDVKTGNPVKGWERGTPGAYIATSPSGNWIVVANTVNQKETFRLINSETGRPHKGALGKDVPGRFMKFTPDGMHIVKQEFPQYGQSLIFVLNQAGLPVSKEWEKGIPGFFEGFTPDASSVVISKLAYDIKTGMPTAGSDTSASHQAQEDFPAEINQRVIAYSPDRQTAIALNSEGNAELWKKQSDGKSLGESETDSKFFRVSIRDLKKQLIFTGSLMVFMAFIFSFPDTFNEIFFQVRPLSPTFYFHEFLHGSWAPDNLNIPGWAKTMIQFPPIHAALSLMVRIEHPINSFVVQLASDFMGIWGYSENGKYVSNILPNIIDMIFGAASLRISEKFHAASLEEGRWQRFFRNSSFAFFFIAMGYFTFSIVYFVSDTMGFEKSLRGGDYSGFSNFFFGLDPGPARTFLCGAMVFSFGFFFVDGIRFVREKIFRPKNKSRFTALAISASIFTASFLTLAIPTLRFMQKNDRSAAGDRSDIQKASEKSAEGKSLGSKGMSENQFADAIYREFRKYLVLSELQMGVGRIGDVGVDAVFMSGDMETLKLHDERAHIERILGDVLFPSEVVMIDIHDYLFKIADSISKDFSGNRKSVINQVVQKIRREALRKKLLSYLETARFEITKGMMKPDSEKIASTMKQIDDHIQIMQQEGCSIAFTLPTAQSWLAWKAMEIIKPDSKWYRFIKRISANRYDESQYLFLGILGPHLRQSADGVDVEAFPLFLESGLRKLDAVFQEIDRLPSGSAERDKQIEHARRISRVVLTGLFFNPGVSVDNKDRSLTGEYDVDLYYVVFNEWMREMAPSVSNPRGLIARIVREFPDLMGDPNADLPLYLTFADKREDATKDQTGQEIIGLFDEFISSRVSDRSGNPIDIFDLIENPDHSLVREFMKIRNWQIPDVQAKFLHELRSVFLAGDIFEDPAAQPEIVNAKSLGMDDPDEFINRLRKNIAGGFKGKSILTIGYGSRLSLIEKLKKLGADITEADRNLDYLKLVRQLVKQMKQRIDTVRLDISKPLPFRGQFDAIVVNNPLSITPAQRAAFLSELTNVVKSGGVIVIYAEKIQPPKRGISHRQILAKFYEKYDYAKLAEAAGFQVLEHDPKAGWTVLKKRAVAASLGLAQLGHVEKGWASVNELTERILLPEDRAVLGEKEFDRLIGAGPAEAKSLGDSVTVVVTEDYFQKNGTVLLKTMHRNDRIFVVVKSHANIKNLEAFGKRIVPVQERELKVKLADRENIFSLEFLIGESIPLANKEMLRFKWDGDVLTNGGFKHQLLSKLRKFLLTTPEQRKTLLQQEGITPKGGFWFLDKTFVEFIDKIVASSLGTRALQRAA